MMKISNPGSWLPQQPPILMLDSASILEQGVSGIGRKQFREDDPWFEGHFPGEPILPGIYLIEGLAQTAMLVLFVAESDAPEREIGYLAKVDKISFHQPVLPGADLEFEIEVTKKVTRFVMVRGMVRQGDETVCRGSLTLAMAT